MLVTRSPVARRTRGDGGRNVIVILADALRADHVGLYGSPRDTTPTLDAAARARGLVFDHASSVSSWTLPAVASLLTGLYPVRHGVVRSEQALLSGSWTTLGDRLRAAGYTTGAVVTNPLIDADHGFAEGFEEFDEGPFMDAGRAFARARTWIVRHREERFFLYLHVMEPHAPYAAAEPFYGFFDPGYAGRIDHDTWSALGNPDVRATLLALAGGLPVDVRDDLGETSKQEGERVGVGVALLQRLQKLYDGEVRYADAELGGLLAFLAEQGLDGETIVVVLSDHGEEFAEHGHLGHMFNLYDTTLRVPLVVLDPDLPAGRRVSAQVSLVDVMPMLLDRLGVRVPEGLDGLTLSQAEAAGPERIVFGQTSSYIDGRAGADLRRTEAACVRDATRKLVYVPRDARWEAYRTDVDPGEQSPESADDPSFEEWRRLVAEHVAPLLQPGRPEPPEPAPGGREEALLRALGYVQ
jgi:arylsulfatase